MEGFICLRILGMIGFSATGVAGLEGLGWRVIPKFLDSLDKEVVYP